MLWKKKKKEKGKENQENQEREKERGGILYIPLHEELVSSFSMSLRSNKLSSTAKTCGFSSPNAIDAEEKEEEEEAILICL